ncbi:FAD-dependent oxidoreductase [Pectobacterium sp. A5351]|uniref:FAD-dependent oxidoreductase n=1 Tax=Pectobacterium sp. A5351 TaxID=2914983 RepID=UPI003FA7E938
MTADSGDKYNKPDLSHVMSLQQHTDDLTNMQATAFAEENRITLLANTRATAIDRHTQQVVCDTERYDYHKLVFATGASAIVPPIPGHEHMLTLNSQQEWNDQGMVAKALDSQQVLRAFVVGGERMKEAFTLLRQLSTVSATTA